MQAGVWQRIHEAVLRQLREHHQIMWIELALTLPVCAPLRVASLQFCTMS
jgi:hypothetical protein